MKSPSDRTATPAGFHRNAWLASIGTGGWFASESVAGFVRIRSMALSEAIAHLNQGLELVTILPQSLERDASELELRSLLGTAWMGLKGWATPEVWTSLHPALALAKSLQRHDALTPIYWGLFANVLTQGRIAESMPWVEETLNVAEAIDNTDLRIVGHMTAYTCFLWLGEFTKVIEHTDKALDLYDAEKHRHLADTLVHDPKSHALLFRSMATWILGFPDQTLWLNSEAEAHARHRGHPFDLGSALTLGTQLFYRLYNYEDLCKRAEELECLGRENSLPLLWGFWAPMLYAKALLREGKPAEAIAPSRDSLAAWEATGGRAASPIWKAYLAEAMALTDDLDGALLLLDEAIAQIEHPGWEERCFYAEILRLKGWMLSLKGDPEGAERNFLASLDWARAQKAKMWELRTSTSLARLWQSQGKRQEAYELLAPVYNWFTEGFDSPDLLEAKALLDELTS